MSLNTLDIVAAALSLGGGFLKFLTNFIAVSISSL
ncbi:unnamed protein product, partial [Rotaria magnacalcarata]